MLKLNTDFETGSGTLHQRSPAHWQLDTVADLFGYNRYFCVQVRNDGDVREVLHLEIHPDPVLGTSSHFMTHFPSHIWCGEANWARWRPLRNSWEDAVQFHAEYLELRVPIESAQTIFLASNVPLKYSALNEWIEQLRQRSVVCVDSLGKSFEDREIPILRLGKVGQPRLLILAGMHSSEHSGVVAAQGIVEYLSSRISQAKRVTELFDIAVIPMLNPDGNVHGYSGGTAQRLAINNSMDFEGAAEGEQPQTHENQLLWQWLAEEFAPDFCLHFHAYLGWKRNGDFPHDGIYLLGNPEEQLSTQRAAQYQAIADRLLFETPAYSAHWRTTGILTEAVLEYQMAKRFDTASVLYEVNAGSVGPSEQFRRGPQVLGAMCRALLDDA